MECKHCQSNYTEKIENIKCNKQTFYEYKCLACQKTFTDMELGERLMTLFYNKPICEHPSIPLDYHEVSCIRFYKKMDGTILCAEKMAADKWKAIYYHSSDFSVLIDEGCFKLRFTGRNGAYVISKIILSDLLTQKALENEAMQILYKNRKYNEKSTFFINGGLKNSQLLKDVETWIKSTLNLPQSNNSGCYVATCVYGSYDCPEVWTLRRFRDMTLKSTWYGRGFIKAYYAVSPKLVKIFGNAIWFKRLGKKYLDKLISKLQKNGIQSTKYEDV